MAATVLHFDLGEVRHRIVVTGDELCLERFDGLDALGVERWRHDPQILRNHLGILDADRVRECLAGAVKAALAHARRAGDR